MPKAVEKLAEKVTALSQSADVQRLVEKVQERQLSLFDVVSWPDSMRAIPNDLARCAVFTVRNKSVPRVACTQLPVFHYNRDVTMLFTGTELRAFDDELVWLQVMEYVKRQPLGDLVQFSFYRMCIDLDWPKNGQNYKRIEQSLSRLFAAAIQITSERLGRLESVKFLNEFRMEGRNTARPVCVVQVDPRILLLFAGDYYTSVTWEKYRTLSPTARRLFDYLASHRAPHPLPLMVFQKICGSSSSRMKKWREQCRDACAELVATGLVDAARVTSDDRIECRRKPVIE